MDRILAAQNLAAEDLLPEQGRGAWAESESHSSVPVVSHATAMHEPIVRPAAVQRLLHLPEELLRGARSRSGPNRKTWLRFVAIQLAAADATAMVPLVFPNAVLLLDRHYNSLAPYRVDRPNLYAVRYETRLVVRFADFQSNRLVLRPHNRDAPVELIEFAEDESPGDHIAGRVVLVLNET